MTILIVFTIIIISTLFWQGSLLLATIIGSPIVYSNKKAVIDAIELAKPKRGELFIDLGCGNGRTLIIAAKKFGLKCIGVDRSLFCYLKANINIILSGQSKNIKVYLGNFDKIEKHLQKADIIYLYLLNSALIQIEDWFFTNISKNARVVSLAFWFPNHESIKVKETFNLGRETKVRLYTK